MCNSFQYEKINELTWVKRLDFKKRTINDCVVCNNLRMFRIFMCFPFKNFIILDNGTGDGLPFV